MQSNHKSILFTLGLILIILFIVMINLFIFVSGPAQKMRVDREKALVRVQENFEINDPISLYDSNYNQSLFIGEGRKDNVEIYFASTPNGNVLASIAKSNIDFNAALAHASLEMEFVDPEARVAYYKGAFVIAILEDHRETLLDILNYSVVFTVEIKV